MAKIGPMLAFYVVFLYVAAFSAPGVQAINICDMKQLPLYMSANSSSLMIVPKSLVQSNLSTLSQPMKVTYWVIDSGWNVIDEGALDSYNDCWLCEFSGKVSDFDASCGPTPFRSGGQFLVKFKAKDFDEVVELESTILVHPKTMSSGTSVDENGNVAITVDAPTDSSSVWVTLYDASDGSMMTDFNATNMTKSDFPGRYTMQITSLGVGTYYASFGFRTTGGDTGGSITRFEIKTKEIELSVDTDKDSYWLGEEVTASGQTKYSQVSATLKHPDGKIESLGTKNVLDGKFEYTFQMGGTYKEGDYTVTASAGGKSQEKTFSVVRVIEVYPTSLTFTVINRTSTLREVVTVQNLGNSTVTLSASAEGVSTYVTMSFDKTTLASQSTAKLTVSVNPTSITSSTLGRVLITGNNIITVPVDVAINLNLPTEPGGDEDAPVLKVSPGYWETDNCMVGGEIDVSFTVQNAGEGNLGNFDKSLSSALDDITDVTLPSIPLSQGSFGAIDMKITPDTTKITGTMEISSNGGSKTIYLSLDCLGDIGSELPSLQSDIEQLKSDFFDAGFSDEVVSSIFSPLDSDVSSSLANMDSDDYASTKLSYSSARVRYDTLAIMLQEIGSAPVQGDTTWISVVVIIVVIAAIGALGFFVYKRFGGRLFKFGGRGEGGGGGEEEPYDEETY
jgi:hypothetical protein